MTILLLLITITLEETLIRDRLYNTTQPFKKKRLIKYLLLKHAEGIYK